MDLRNVNNSTMLFRVLVACVSLALVAARVTAGHTNLVRKFDDKDNPPGFQPNLQSRSGVGNFLYPSSTEPKPVNEKFPSAVLFGRTCGGTILSEKWILTAAHCTLFTGGREILAGTNNTMNGSGVKRRVKKLYLHPKFTVGPYWLDAKRFNITQVAAHYDFLLAELDEPLPLNDKTIKAVNLDPYDMQPGTLVGYGGYGAENHGETMRHEMHGMEMALLSDAECSSLRQYDNQSMICARGVLPRLDSACNGDSGSGLVDENNGLIGVASWVEDDAFRCFNGAKVVFGKVSAARPWIREITGL